MFVDLFVLSCLILEADFLPLISGVVSALVMLLLVDVAVICVQRKKQTTNQPKKRYNLLFTHFTHIIVFFCCSFCK